MAEIEYNPFSSRKNGLSILARCTIIIRPGEIENMEQSPSLNSIDSTASTKSSSSRKSRKRRKRLAVLLVDNHTREGYIFCFRMEKHWDYFQHLHSELFMDDKDIAWNTITSDQYLNSIIQLNDAHIDSRTLPNDKKETYFPKANVIFIQRNESENPMSLTAKSLNGSYLIFKDDDYIQWIGWMQKIRIASSLQRQSEEIDSGDEDEKLNEIIDQVEERVHAIPTPQDSSTIQRIDSSSTIDSEADKAEVTVSNSEENELIQNDVDNDDVDESDEKCAELVSNISGYVGSVSSSVSTPSSEDAVIVDATRNTRKFSCGEKAMLIISFLIMGGLTAGYWEYSLQQQQEMLAQEEAEYLEMLRNQEIEANLKEMAEKVHQDGIFFGKLLVFIIIIVINFCCCGKVYLCRGTSSDDDDEESSEIEEKPKANSQKKEPKKKPAKRRKSLRKRKRRESNTYHYV